MTPCLPYRDPIWALYDGPDTPIVRGVLIAIIVVGLCSAVIVLWVDLPRLVRWVLGKLR